MWGTTGAPGDGGSLRKRLAGVIVVPLLGVCGFAAIQVHSRLASAQDASRAQEVVRGIGLLSQTRSDVVRELLPDLMRTVRHDPALIKKLDLDEQSLTILPSDAATTGLREATDARLRSIATVPLIHGVAVSSLRDLRRARTEIDRGSALAGFADARRVLDRLTQAQRRHVDELTDTSLAAAGARAVHDLQAVAALSDHADTELLRLVTTLLPARTSDRVAAAQDWVDGWSQYRSAALSARSVDSPQVRTAVVKALDFGSARAFDSLAQQAVRDSSSVSVADLLTMYPLGQVRDALIAGALQAAVDRSSDAARAQHAAAWRDLTTTLVAIAVLMLICAVIGWLVWRSTAGPLDRLAASARKVSEGVLDDVPVDGPHEVRTAARGLSAAVASLRNIEAQAAAVASGDLDSDVVKRPLPGPLGEVVHASIEMIVSAIHDRDRAQTDLAYRAAHDVLTDLPNRAEAMTAIEQALDRSSRSGGIAGLLFIDLDHFKRVNDTFGHDAGDLVLRVVAERMRAQMRTSDVVARLGGDEFVIVAEHIENEEVLRLLAERLIESIVAPIRLASCEVRVGASVGVAVSRASEVDASRLLAEADAAAYRAKKAGRSRVAVFDDDLRECLNVRAALEAAIAEGLRNDEFVLHYQPVVRMRTGAPIGVEALIRWDRPGHGLLPPADFIPVAEDSTLINDIGRWTLLEATRQLAAWDAEGGDADLTVAVNISGRHIGSRELLTDVHSALTSSGIAAHRLVVEVTETVLVDDPVATANMSELRELGVLVAIDDFGTGYTSIGQLPRLPIDIVKIDRSFVASEDPAHRDLVRLIVAAAHAFEISVVAEGVELPAQVNAMNAVDIETGQGFYFARPQNADTAAALTQLPTLPQACETEERPDAA